MFGALVEHNLASHAIDWISNRNKCCLCVNEFEYSDTSALLDHLTEHTPEFTYFECKCARRIKKYEQMKNHVITHHAIEADECAKEVSNLNQLFTGLLQKVKERDHHLMRAQTTANETENAIQGLMDEEFVMPFDESQENYSMGY